MTFRRLLPWIAAVVGTLIYHRYTIATGFDAVQADKGDSRYIAFVLEHWNTWANGHARLGSPLIFFPILGTLGYSDALAGMGLVHIVLRAAGIPVFTAMNVQLVLLSLAAFGGMYLFLVRGFRLGVVAATAGAYLFAFSWPRFAELVHVQMQFMFVLPLMALLALECLRDGQELSRWRFAWRALAFVALLALTMATAVYIAEFFVLFLGVTMLLTLFSISSWRHYWLILKRHWPGLAAAVGFGALLAVPIAHVYLPVMRQSGGRTWDTVYPQLLDPIDLIWLGRENTVWGWLFERWPAWSVDKWYAKRLGIGVIGTFVWLAALVWAIRTLLRRPPGRLADGTRNLAVASLIIVAAGIVQLAALRFGSQSLWWFIYEFVPGMNGIRTVGRIQLVATLPMGLGLALFIDWICRADVQPRHVWIIALLLAAIALEQIGVVQRYSAREAEAFSRRVTDAIPRTCKAAYVLATEGFLPTPPVIENEAQFDAAAYLRANPDVAESFKGPAWQHYLLFGRKEHRSLDLSVSRWHAAMMFFYNYTIPLGATLAGIPVVNGLSGWQPPQWDLFDVFAPDAPEHMAQWMRLNHRDPSDVCIVRLAMPYDAMPEIELRDD